MSTANISEVVAALLHARMAEKPELFPNRIDPASRYDETVDPGGGIDGMPVNLGRHALPHVSTFAGLQGGAAHTYRPSDEALRHSLANARFMRNDTSIMECVEMRSRAVCLLDWHVEPEDAKNARQQQIAAELTAILKRIPRFMQYRENLLNATWFGRYAVQNRWRWGRVGHAQRLYPMSWIPVHGDKLVFRFDDGSGRYRADQVGIRVGANAFQPGPLAKWLNQRRHKIQATDQGLAYFLDSWERPLLSLHRHAIEDGEWEDPQSSGRIHGVGLRSRVYWTWYQKQETLAFLMEYLERCAAGFEIWYYPMHNPTAKEEVRKAAIERSELGRNVVFVPRPTGDDAALYDMQRIEPSMAGVIELKSLVTEYFGHQIKRYILGQTLTSEAESTGLGSAVADAHQETFMIIVRYDAVQLEESITDDTLTPIVRYNYPDQVGVRYRFVIDTESVDAEAKMAAFMQAWQMGLTLRGEDVRDLIGAAKPEGDDEVLSMEQQQQQAAMQQQGAPGMPPGGEGGAEPDLAESDEGPPLKMSARATPATPNDLGVWHGEGDRMVLVPADGPRAHQELVVA